MRRHIQSLDLSEEAKALLERSSRPIRGLEVRADEGSDSVAFGGFAVKWNEPTLIRTWFDEYLEQFARGSWAETIAERGPTGSGQIKLCYKHDGASLMFGGGPTAGRLTSLEETDDGVRYEAETIDTSTGRDLAAELRAGTVDRNSFAFEATRESWDKDSDPWLCTVEKCTVWEVSPVNWPAYAGSVIDSVRSEVLASPMAEAMKDALETLRSGREVSPSALRAIEEAASLARDIEAQIRSGSAGADDADDRAGALVVKRRRLELTKHTRKDQT